MKRSSRICAPLWLGSPVDGTLSACIGRRIPLGPTAEGWGLRWPSLGESFVRQEPVTNLIAEAFPGTILLALTALAFALVVGIPMGLFATRNPGGVFDRVVVGGSVLGMSAPSFFAAVLIGYLFAVQWGAWTGLPLTGSLWDLDEEGRQVVSGVI